MALLTSFNEWHCRSAWVGTHLVAILFHNNQNELGYFIILCYIVGIYLYFLCSMYIWIGLLSLFVVLSMVAICSFWRCKNFLWFIEYQGMLFFDWKRFMKIFRVGSDPLQDLANLDIFICVFPVFAIHFIFKIIKFIQHCIFLSEDWYRV